MLLKGYTASWEYNFNKISHLIKDALPDTNISIEHVGSTSVPGLSAKPIIDIDIIFYLKADFDAIKRGLEKIGYYHNGNQGIPDREVFKRSNVGPKHNVLDTIIHHLYVCPDDSLELQKHILFRNYLKANEEARLQYQILKYAIAKEANQDRKKYTEFKEVLATEFINAILEKARQEFNGKPKL